MSAAGQVVVIDPLATAFSAVCEQCGVTFAGRLDADLDAGTFLCRAGHAIRVERQGAGASQSESTRAA